jgi:hypothetical protein
VEDGGKFAALNDAFVNFVRNIPSAYGVAMDMHLAMRMYALFSIGS